VERTKHLLDLLNFRLSLVMPLTRRLIVNNRIFLTKNHLVWVGHVLCALSDLCQILEHGAGETGRHQRVRLLRHHVVPHVLFIAADFVHLHTTDQHHLVHLSRHRVNHGQLHWRLLDCSAEERRAVDYTGQFGGHRWVVLQECVDGEAAHAVPEQEQGQARVVRGC